VSLAPGEPARLVQAEDEPLEVQRWRLEALDPSPGYAAALAVEGWDWHLRCWRWLPACACQAGS
jgi:4'-phosphopantetheinyl transferase